MKTKQPPRAVDRRWIALGAGVASLLVVGMLVQSLLPPAPPTGKSTAPTKTVGGRGTEGLDPSRFPGLSTAEPADTRASTPAARAPSRRSQGMETLDPAAFYAVGKVADGDTLEVLDGGTPRRIRLFGVDCPETKQAYGPEAKAFTQGFVGEKKVRVVVKDVDQYGRLVGQVFLEDGRSLNEALVENGCAWWYRTYDKKNATLDRLETAARQGKVGLWAEAAPTPPWAWRAKHRRED